MVSSTSHAFCNNLLYELSSLEDPVPLSKVYERVSHAGVQKSAVMIYHEKLAVVVLLWQNTLRIRPLTMVQCARYTQKSIVVENVGNVSKGRCSLRQFPFPYRFDVILKSFCLDGPKPELLCVLNLFWSERSAQKDFLT